MRSYISNSVNEAFLSIAEDLIKNPEYVTNPRGMETREILNINLELLNPFDRIVLNKHREISYII